MSYYVYMLLSFHKNKYFTYVGYSKEIYKRLILHNKSKGAKSTRGKLWYIIYKKKYINKSLALKAEYKLKHDKIKRKRIKINFLKKNENFYFTSL